MNVHKICKTPSFPRQLRPSAAIFCYLPLLARLICGSVQARSAKKPLPGLAGGDGGASVQVAATGKARAAQSALAAPVSMFA